MNILVVTGSPRKNGNTEIMAGVFAAAAVEAGHQVTVRKLSEAKVNPCIACKYCFTHDGICVQNDDMNEILNDLNQADMLVFALRFTGLMFLLRQNVLLIECMPLQ